MTSWLPALLTWLLAVAAIGVMLRAAHTTIRRIGQARVQALKEIKEMRDASAA